MNFRPTFLALLAAPVLALAACQAPPPRVSGGGGGAASGQADPATIAYCRQQAEDVYNAQNRGARLQLSTSDSPFSSSPAPVSATRGLADRYAMDAMIGDCIRNAANRLMGPDTGAAPAQAQPVVQARAGSRPASPPPLPSGPAGGPPVSAAPVSGVPLERAPPPPPPVRP